MSDQLRLVIGLLALHLVVFGFALYSDLTSASNVNSIEELYNPELAPFYHGVASRDPYPDSVLIWTRVTPEMPSDADIDVTWQIASDPEMINVIASDTITKSRERDFTVKVIVEGLEPHTHYYYNFSALGGVSSIGRTKTAPDGAVDELKFAVASCANLLWGEFAAYGHIADRDDLDAVIYMGDYFYEYANDGSYGHPKFVNSRAIFPPHELVSLEDYRLRYQTYRLDSQLQRVHQMHPFIAVWDDHESANDAWATGAQNHNPNTEGEWEARKAAARRAYSEWMPIRGDAHQIYRAFSYGPLADIIMLDTRLEGRERPIHDVNNPELYSPDRTLLGAEQKTWLKDELLNSDTTWRVIGTQVIFSEFNVGWAAPVQGRTADALESLFLDIWDGYSAERRELIEFINQNNIFDNVFVTGDFHSAYAFDVMAEGVYTHGVEFVSPSITSANLNELQNPMLAEISQYFFRNPIFWGDPNPHLEYLDILNHGYFVLSLTPDHARADYYFVYDVRNPDSREYWAMGLETQRGASKLERMGEE